MERATTYDEFSKRRHERQEAVRANTSRRLRGLDQLPLPEKLAAPLVPIAYDAEGAYAGRLSDPDECPAGCTIKWEEATR